MRDLANGIGARSTMRTLLGGVIDYAGLFPPAALAMSDAVRNYAEYVGGPDAWALGRFVVPIARLREFGAAAAPSIWRTARPWRLSVLAGGSAADEWAAAERAELQDVVMDAIELRVGSVHDVATVAAKIPSHVSAFYEIPIDADPAPLIAAIGRAGGNAKVRTGGVTADAFPAVSDLARFIVVCTNAGVPFKATAGLHHPLRSVRALTYAPDSLRAEMFGFLNVLLAAAFARAGMGVDGVASLLEERDAGSFRFDGDGVVWRGQRVAPVAVAEARAQLSLSFGSCSFTEPIAELRELGLL